MTKTIYSKNITVKLKEIGESLKIARKRRRKSLRMAAEMIGVSISSLQRVEKGDPSVKFGMYLSILEAYQLFDQFIFPGPQDDDIGLALEKQRLPQRIREKKEKRLDF